MSKGELRKSIVCVSNKSHLPVRVNYKNEEILIDDVVTLALYVEHCLIKSGWEKYGKDTSYNKYTSFLSYSPLFNLSFEERSARSRKAMDTMGPEGLHDKGLKTAATQLKNGTHPWQNPYKTWTKEELHNRAIKGVPKANEGRATELVFYNPTTGGYRVHVANWNTRYKAGFSERLCKYSEWESYREANELFNVSL